MAREPQDSWRPDSRFLLRGGLTVFGVGVIVASLTQLGAGEFYPTNLLLSGVASVLVFLIICSSLILVLPRIRFLRGIPRAAVLAGVFFVAGALAWLVMQLLIVSLGIASPPTWRQIAANIATNGMLAILFGSGFYLYEATRQRWLESTSRLKEAEFAEKELALARSIQERLLPPVEVSGDGYRIAARHLPARYVAGDFFDVFSLPGGTLGLVVADVAGKGVGASLVMASVKAMLPLLAVGRSVEETLKALNERLCGELERRQFVALAYAHYRPADGELMLANAGLPDPYLLRRTMAPLALTVQGPRMPLGLKRDQEYRARQMTLSPGDALLLFTDGLPEAPDASGDPLGYEVLSNLLPALESAPGDWLDELFSRVEKASERELVDDWTALLMECRDQPV